MGILSKAKDWISASDMDDLEDDYSEFEEEDEEEEEEEYVEAPRKKTRVVNAKRPLPSTKDCAIAIYHPTSYQDATKIGTTLKNRKAAIVNVAELPKEQSKRITDFLQGIVFAIDGNYYIVGDKVILYVPKNIDVDDVDGAASNED